MYGQLRAVGMAAIAAICLLALIPAPAAAIGSCDGSADVIVSADDIAAAERTLLCLVNARRGEARAQSLRMDTNLLFAARAHSADMVERNYYSHSSPEGSVPGDRATDAGYPSGVAVGEVLAKSADDPTPANLYAQIVNSAVDNELILRAGFQTTGIGLAIGTPGGPGLTMTLMVGTADTKADDTAVDLFTRVGCAPLTARLQLADARFAKKDNRVVEQARAVKKLRKEVGQANSQGERDALTAELRAAKRTLRHREKVRDRAGKALQLTYEAADRACDPQSFKP